MRGLRAWNDRFCFTLTATFDEKGNEFLHSNPLLDKLMKQSE